MNVKSKVPLIKEKEEMVQFIARGPQSLRDRLDKAVEKLKKTDPKRKWSLNNVMIAGLETFLELVEDKNS